MPSICSTGRSVCAGAVVNGAFTMRRGDFFACACAVRAASTGGAQLVELRGGRRPGKRCGRPGPPPPLQSAPGRPAIVATRCAAAACLSAVRAGCASGASEASRVPGATAPASRPCTRVCHACRARPRPLASAGACFACASTGPPAPVQAPSRALARRVARRSPASAISRALATALSISGAVQRSRCGVSASQQRLRPVQGGMARTQFSRHAPPPRAPVVPRRPSQATRPAASGSATQGSRPPRLSRSPALDAARRSFSLCLGLIGPCLRLGHVLFDPAQLAKVTGMGQARIHRARRGPACSAKSLRGGGRQRRRMRLPQGRSRVVASGGRLGVGDELRVGQRIRPLRCAARRGRPVLRLRASSGPAI